MTPLPHTTQSINAALRASGIPVCSTCDRFSRLTNGKEIYPHRPDLHDKSIWKCDGCGGRVGCHDGTINALGTPANYELRQARMILHDQMIDPLWQDADKCGAYAPEDDRARKAIRRAARNRIYAYLADKLGIERDACHTGMFDLETCRRAWVVLRGITYLEIRQWAKARKIGKEWVHGCPDCGVDE